MPVKPTLKGGAMSLNDALRIRRSVYAINDEMPVGEDEVVRLVEEATALVPDAFDMKSQRVIVALGEKNQAFWDAVFDAFGGKVAREKIDGFAAGAGTVLYFVDGAVVASMQEQYPRYAENFPTWAQQANGMLQVAVWSGLAELGVGANIQHYNPVIDDAVRELFGVLESWSLVAQMPFGGIAAAPGPKAGEDIALRVRVER